MFKLDNLGIIIEAPSGPYPFGRLINSSPPGSGNGSPAVAEWANDSLMGMYAALAHFGLTPSDLQEQVGNSDLVKLFQAALPVGALIEFAIDTDPSTLDIRALECDGSTVSEVTYADLFAVLGTKWNTGGEPGGEFRLPDWRGKFVRGFDNGAGIDSGRVFAAAQLDQFQGHEHTMEWLVRTLDAGATIASDLASTGVSKATSAIVTDGVSGVPRVGDQTYPINETAAILIRY